MFFLFKYGENALLDSSSGPAVTPNLQVVMVSGLNPATLPPLNNFTIIAYKTMKIASRKKLHVLNQKIEHTRLLLQCPLFEERGSCLYLIVLELNVWPNYQPIVGVFHI